MEKKFTDRSLIQFLFIYFFILLLTSNFLTRLEASRRSALCIVSRWNFDGFALKIGYQL